MNKTQSNLSTKQMLSLNFGSFGIQFAFSIVIANVSGIFAMLGVTNDSLAYVWFGPSLIGLLLPPIVGYMSDKTNSQFGPRIPYIFVGALITAISMAIMPNTISPLFAAILLFFLMGAINISLQPSRSLVADIVAKELHTKIYAMQAVMIGIGAVIASSAPWLFSSIIGFQHNNISTHLPYEIKYSFYIGAIIVLISNIWTSIYAKKHLKKYEPNTKYTPKDLFAYLLKMPKAMRQIFLVQIFTWIGTFILVIYLTPTIEQNIFHIPIISHHVHNINYQSGIEKSTVLTGITCASYMLINILVAYCIPLFLKILNRKTIHIIALLLGACSLFAISIIHNSHYLLLAMAGIGAAWASFNSIPFAIVADSVPSQEMGLAMGIFNISICLPQVIVSLLAGLFLKNILGGNVDHLIITAAIFYLLATFFMLPIKNKP
ncbi:MAG: MFS transporter [Gammaproteobacteria bacterium]|nr:MFS transporter [Gammaproteobacteria bacterium]